MRLLTVNIYRTAGESWQTFKYITDSSCNFGFLEAEAARVVGASMMYGISGRLRKKYDITGDVREELYKAADSWTDAVGTSRYCSVLLVQMLSARSQVIVPKILSGKCMPAVLLCHKCRTQLDGE